MSEPFAQPLIETKRKKVGNITVSKICEFTITVNCYLQSQTKVVAKVVQLNSSPF